ncbi:acyl-CoA N-acyltransferase [Hyaloraphidium curvatum]|nr:acyl-CoA N-acyltransferase [Hyaloraphidium curvatum]
MASDGRDGKEGLPDASARPPAPFDIRPADFSSPALLELLRFHLDEMRSSSPPGTAYALDLSGVQRPDVSLYTAWDGDALVAMGGLRELSPTHGEIKSMRTHPDHLRRGAGAAMLEHIIAEARWRGYARLSLETGSGPTFEAALAMYTKRGFAEGEVFADYGTSGFNRFFHLDLAEPRTVFHVRPADFSSPELLALLQLHLDSMRANLPSGTGLPLDFSDFRRPDVSVYAAWDGPVLVAVGAVRQLSPTHGEIKSMRTHPDHLRRGAGAAILDHIIGEARRRGYARLSLETGRGPAFEAALAIYTKAEFREGEGYAGYEVGGFSRFLHLDLAREPGE